MMSAHCYQHSVGSSWHFLPVCNALHISLKASKYTNKQTDKQTNKQTNNSDICPLLLSVFECMQPSTFHTQIFHHSFSTG